jgi:pimeloyl-ACP methyl ester carboxylesterase
MPRLNVNGAELHVEDRGLGPETIVFSHGLLMSGRMFDKQVNALADRYRCVRWDHRGQGLSQVTASGYDMDSLTEDAAALIRQLECAPCHFLGLSMGGFVGMRLAIRHAPLLRSLILVDTSADPESEKARASYRRLNFVARWVGLGLVVDRVMSILFGPGFMEDEARAEERALWRERLKANHRVGVTRATTGVLDRDGVYDQLETIGVPTLIIVGDQDVATPPEKAERMHAKIPNSKLVVIPGAGHTATVEEPAAVNAAIDDFLRSLD